MCESTIVFTVEQVAALYGGELPGGNGLWKGVSEFRLEGKILEPYAFNQILPLPGIHISKRLTNPI